jgi:hypothetical protein
VFTDTGDDPAHSELNCVTTGELWKRPLQFTERIKTRFGSRHLMLLKFELTDTEKLTDALSARDTESLRVF